MNNGCDALIAIYCLEYCNCGQYIFLCRCNVFFRLLYTMIGGVEAVAWTDASQVIVLIGFATTVQVLTCVQLPYGIINTCYVCSWKIQTGIKPLI